MAQNETGRNKTESDAAAPLELGLQTRAVHSGSIEPRVDGAVCTPIFQSSTYEMVGEVAYDDIRYLRLNNTPNHNVVAKKVAALEGVEAGLVAASGMAAISTALLTLLAAGDEIIVQSCLYGGTQSLLEQLAARYGVVFRSVDLNDPAAWEDARSERTRAFYVESMTNPLVEVGRLDEVADFCRKHELTSVIDNTFPTPALFRPVTLGYDVILHSATKALNGHSDLVAGVVTGRTEWIQKARKTLNLIGGSLDAHACFLLERGIKTLPLRVRAQGEGAQHLAESLASHPRVRRVHYPGLPTDPSHERAQRWFTSSGVPGFGSMLSILIDAPPAAIDFALERLEIGLLAPSLGGVETLVSRPASTSHAGLSPQQRDALGIEDGHVRISVGIEDSTDLVRDFTTALDRVG